MNYDKKRQNYLESLGLKVHIIFDSEIKKDLVNVMLNLESFIINEYGLKTQPSATPPIL